MTDADRELVELFEGLDTPGVSDALDKLGLGGQCFGVMPLADYRSTVVGPAYPLACAPGDNLAIHVAMERAPRGSVLVVATGDYLAGYWGEVLAVAAEAAGIVGLVIDGGVRDVAHAASRRSRAAPRAGHTRHSGARVCVCCARPSPASSGAKIPRSYRRALWTRDSTV